MAGKSKLTKDIISKINKLLKDKKKLKLEEIAKKVGYTREGMNRAFISSRYEIEHSRKLVKKIIK
jgi:hypothetical protein